MSMTITLDLGVVRVAYDLLDDAGAAEVMAGVDMMRALIRSARFRALVMAAREFISDNPFDVVDSSDADTLDDSSDRGRADDTSATPSHPAVAQPASTYEFVGLRMSDRGELRAISSSGKYARYGWALGALRDEYLRRAGVSTDAVASLTPGAQIMHRSVKVHIDSSGSRFVDTAR